MLLFSSLSLSLSLSLSPAPTAPVGSITFTSVTPVSMNVSWDPVPCNRRNGPIAGYYLTYTGSTFNITDSDTRYIILEGLMPYTNYTVSVTPYNVNGEEGPLLDGVQLTGESGELINDDKFFVIIF